LVRRSTFISSLSGAANRAGRMRASQSGCRGTAPSRAGYFRTRWAEFQARRAVPASLAPDGLEVYDRERWERDGEHLGSPVPVDRRRFDAAKVAQPAAAVRRGVAVQYLTPDATAGDADAVVVAWQRREVEHGEDHLGR